MADDLQRPTADLYERDYVAWAEAQAASLRSPKGGATALDYDNLAEEIEDLGKSEQRACASQVENIIEHLLKIEFVGPLQTLPHWRKELRGFRRELNERRTATIDRRLKARLQGSFAYVVKSLIEEELLQEAAVSDVRTDYGWDEIIDPDWYPRPLYAV